MPDLLDKTEATSVSQTDAAVYAVINRTTTPADRWMQPANFFKARTGNESVLGYASLSAAVTAIGATQATIEIPATTTVSATLTIPSNITLLFIGQGMISVASAQTLTVNGPVQAPLRQVFTGTGTVKFGGRVALAYPEWFGAAGDNSTDDQAAIQKAIDAFKDTGIEHHPGVVEFTGGYAVGSTVLITGNSVTLRGPGWGVQNDTPYRGFIRWIGSAGTPLIKITECWMSGVENIRLIGKSSAKPTAAIEFASTNVAHGLDNSFARHVFIGAMFGYDSDNAIQFDAGILFSGTVDGDSNTFEHIHIVKCTTGVDIQNTNASVSHWNTLMIDSCTTGFKTVTYSVGTNWFFANNGVDFLVSGDGAKLMLREIGSEGSTRMAQVTGVAAQLIVIGGTWGALSTFTPADTGSLRWFIDAVPAGSCYVHLEDFELVQSGNSVTPVIRIGNTSSSSSAFLRLIKTNLSSLNIRTEPTGLNFLSHGVCVESTQNVTNGTQPHIWSRCILDYTRTTEDSTFQPYRNDFPGKVNVFGGPLKVKSVFKPTGVAATNAVGSGATTYSYRVTALTYDGETEPSTAATCTNAASLGASNKNLVSWVHCNGAYAYRIYGRTSGTELLLITLPADQMTSGPQWAYDDGSLTPSGALPTINTTGNASVERLFSAGKGTDVASAAAIVPTGNIFHVTGTTTITSITATNIPAGTVITIIFDGILTFTDGSNLVLAGNFVTSAGDTITLAYDGTSWHEIARSVN